VSPGTAVHRCCCCIIWSQALSTPGGSSVHQDSYSVELVVLCHHRLCVRIHSEPRAQELMEGSSFAATCEEPSTSAQCHSLAGLTQCSHVGHRQVAGGARSQAHGHIQTLQRMTFLQAKFHGSLINHTQQIHHTMSTVSDIA